MNKNDKKPFAALLAGLAEAFDVALSPSRIEIYFNALSDMSLEQVQEAGSHLARSSRFFPKPVDFREAVLPDAEAQALHAYDKVAEASKAIGAYSSVSFGDPVIHKIIDSLGGWVDVCSRPADAEKEKWWKKEFERMYRLYAGQQGWVAPYVARGLHDKENEQKGLPAGQVVSIGEGERLVLTEGYDVCQPNDTNMAKFKEIAENG